MTYAYKNNRLVKKLREELPLSASEIFRFLQYLIDAEIDNYEIWKITIDDLKISRTCEKSNEIICEYINNHNQHIYDLRKQNPMPITKKLYDDICKYSHLTSTEIEAFIDFLRDGAITDETFWLIEESILPSTVIQKLYAFNNGGAN